MSIEIRPGPADSLTDEDIEHLRLANEKRVAKGEHPISRADYLWGRQAAIRHGILPDPAGLPEISEEK